MQKIALIALAASAAIATPAIAAAQNVTGTINLTGSVAGRCSIQTSGGSTFADTVAFGELAATNGTLRTGLATQFDTRSASVVCTTAAPMITVAANALKASTPVTATGYADRIDFTASVAVVTTGTSPAPFSNASGVPPVAVAIGGRLANSANNINITTSNYHTAATNDLLVADPTYTGSVIVTITPA